MCDLKCCANCKHWYCYDEESFKKLDGHADGECRRFPPNVPIFETTGDDSINVAKTLLCVTRGTVMMSYPFTFEEDWCGEFDWADKLRISDDDDYEEWESNQEV